ncbi:uncharacterized protein [Branchiostoma lanceolatum]|uniref:uncharacterized protein n=1 Tax=Branchiostoma lanceolatum TaxID=7740 RepID=UPI003456FBEC
MGGCNQSRVQPVNFDVVPQCKRTWFDTHVKGRARRARKSLMKCLNLANKTGREKVVVPALRPVEADLILEDVSSCSASSSTPESRPESRSESRSESSSESWSESESALDLVVVPLKLPGGQTVLIEKTREEVLLTNLAKAGYELDPVPRNGDGFFSAAVRQLGRGDPHIETTAEQLRQDLVRYIRDHSEKYFFYVPGSFCNFQQQVNSLAQQGHWCSDLTDILPIVLADCTSRKVVLITSTPNQQFMSLPPTEGDQSGSPVVLAYLNTPGREHYDAVRCVG